MPACVGLDYFVYPQLLGRIFVGRLLCDLALLPCLLAQDRAAAANDMPCSFSAYPLTLHHNLLDDLRLRRRLLSLLRRHQSLSRQPSVTLLITVRFARRRSFARLSSCATRWPACCTTFTRREPVFQQPRPSARSSFINNIYFWARPRSSPCPPVITPICGESKFRLRCSLFEDIATTAPRLSAWNGGFSRCR